MIAQRVTDLIAVITIVRFDLSDDLSRCRRRVLIQVEKVVLLFELRCELVEIDDVHVDVRQ